MSEQRDIPIIFLVRNSRFIAYTHLVELLKIGTTKSARTYLDWRLRRLVNAGYLEVGRTTRPQGRMYFASRMALELLELRGHGLVSFASDMNRSHNPHMVKHSLGLNELRIAFERLFPGTRWRTDLQVSSDNMMYGDKYAKDYDALAMIPSQKGCLRLGIEYERTSKSKVRYSEIRQTLKQEQLLDYLFYFVSETDRLFSIAETLGGAHPFLYFLSERAFLEQGMNTLMMRTPVEPCRTLSEIVSLQPSLPHSRQMLISDLSAEDSGVTYGQ